MRLLFNRVTSAPAWVGLIVLLSGCGAYFAQQNTLPHAYLEQAREAAQAHDAARTLAALEQAEGASVLTSSGRTSMNYDTQTLRQIDEARQSVAMQRWGDALYYINTALTDPETIEPR